MQCYAVQNQLLPTLLETPLQGSYTIWKVAFGPSLMGLWSWSRVRGRVACFLDKLQIISSMGMMEEIFLWLQVLPWVSSG